MKINLNNIPFQITIQNRQLFYREMQKRHVCQTSKLSIRTAPNSNMDMTQLLPKVQTGPLHIRKRLFIKYSTSQHYYYGKLISEGIQKKKCCTWIISLKDALHQTYQEQLQKYYKQKQLDQQIPSLIQYYKYYSQKALNFNKQHFRVIFNHQEKHKIIQYNRLKRILSLESQQKESQRSQSAKKQIGSNILSQISSNKNQQSYCFNKLKQDLTKCFGISKCKSIKQIDNDYQNYQNRMLKKKKPKNKRSSLGEIDFGNQINQQSRNTLTRNSKRNMKKSNTNSSCPDLKENIRNYPHQAQMIKKKPKLTDHCERLQTAPDSTKNVVRKQTKYNFQNNFFPSSSQDSTPHLSKKSGSYVPKNNASQQQKIIKANITQFKNKIRMQKQKCWKKIISSTQNSCDTFKSSRKWKR